MGAIAKSLLPFFLLSSSLSLIGSSAALPAEVREQDSFQHASGYICNNLVIPFSVTENSDGHFEDDNYSIEVLHNFMDFRDFRTATYNISAIYCAPPARAPKRQDTIQMLVHGATFSKTMWDWPWQPEKYSWVRRMHAEGYPTLTFDLIGSGNSSHPHPVYEVQTQLIVEQVHHMFKLLKAGQIGGVVYDKVAYVGFSIASIAGVSLAYQVPDAIDALVLHGFTWDIQDLYPAFLSGLQVAANGLEKPEWKQYPAEYTTQMNPAGRRAAVFYGNFDPEIVPVDFYLRDLDTLGLSISLAYHLVTPNLYKGPVMLANGDQDATFCGRACGSAPYELYDRFPNATDHDIKVYPQAGHGIHLHHYAQQLMDDTLAFLKRNGF
ncbi:Alpha/Beta hydrolase protein [Aspergillus ambiguus]|uniref:alpha/beta fold hydrolase n=1 Tax=Aspergillus ambiguus TaxID=176160 RepID=UPI003CCE351F